MKIVSNKVLRIKRTVFFSLTVGWMAVIFLFSAQNGSHSSETSGGLIEWLMKLFNPDFDSLSAAEQDSIVASWQFFVRKAAHFSAYAILGVLSTLSFDTVRLKKPLYFALPTLLSLGYAALDEFHQTFVPGRAGRVTDVLIDLSGAVVGILVVRLTLFLIRKRAKANKKDFVD